MLRRLLAPGLALVALAGLTRPAAAQPTPDFTWNNFAGAGTTWGGTNNWLLGTGPTSTTIGLSTTNNATSSVLDRVLAYVSSPLQTATGYSSTNSLGTFDLNALTFAANTAPLGGVTVTNSAGAANTLRFNTSTTGTLPAIYQNGTGRVQLLHADAAGLGVTLAGGTTGTTLQVLGNGVGDVFLAAGITQTGAASGLLINQTGARNFFTGSQVRLSGASNNFTGGVTLTAGNLVLSNTTSSATAVVLTAGQAYTPISSLGTGTLTITGGSLAFDATAAASGASPTGISGSFLVSTTIQINSTLNLTGTNVGATAPNGNVVAAFTGQLTGPGGVTVTPYGGFGSAYAFTGTSNFTGPVVVNPNGSAAATLQLGTAGLSGGQFAGATSYTVNFASTLLLNNIAGVTTRLNTTTAPSLTLNRSNVQLSGNGTANSAEVFGGLTVTGMGQITVLTGGGTTTAGLTFASLARGATGTLSVTATNLGSGTASNEGLVTFTTDPGGAVGGGGGVGTLNRNVLPYALGNATAQIAGAANSAQGFPVNGTTSPAPVFGLVRYDSVTGRLALLNPATEYSGLTEVQAGTAAGTNLRLASNGGTVPANAGGLARQNAPLSVNGLVLDTNIGVATTVGSTAVSVQGTGVLTVTGGAVLTGFNGTSTATALSAYPSLINTAGLNFGAATGYIHTGSAVNTGQTANLSPNLAVNAPITGSGGLVKSQNGTLFLNATNPFTGGLSVNAGSVTFTSDANLGAAGEPLFLNAGVGTALNLQPTNQFGPATAGAVTVNRPVTIGAGGGVVGVVLANNNLTFSGPINGTGQLAKVGLGIVTLSGTNGYTGNTVAVAGILAAQSDAALGATGVGGSNVLLSGGTFQPLTSFTTARDFLVTASSTVFTGGQNLQVDGNVTAIVPSASTYTLFKVGAGTLTLTGQNTFNQAFQLGESTPTIRATAAAAAQPAGNLTLSGPNGSLAQASSVFSIGGGELTLDNSTAVNQNRLGNVTLSLIGGNATLVGNTGTAVNEQIGSISITNANNQYGGRLTLAPPSGGQAVVTLTSTAAYSPQAAPNVGSLFVRANNLGAATGPDRGAVVFQTAPTTVPAANGLIPSILVAGGAAGALSADATDFATTVTQTGTSPNGNQFNLVPFSAYTPAAGGSLATGAAATTYDVSGAASFSGAAAANAVKLSGGGSLDLNGNTLTLTAGSVLTTGGANGGIVSTGGTGTLSYGAGVTARFSVAAGSDLTLGSATTPVNVTGTTGGLNKLGTGTLTVNGTITTTTGLVGISAGTLKLGTGGSFLPLTVQPSINVGATLDVSTANTTLGGLTGWGDTNLGATTLTLNTATSPALGYAGGFVGTGTLVKTGTATQVLVGNSPGFNGGVQVLGGTNTGTQATGLVLNSSGALGVGTSPIQLGDTGTVQASLVIGSSVSAFNRDITVPAPIGTAPATPHTFGISANTMTVGSNFTLGQTLRLTNTANNVGNASLNGLISGAGSLNIFFGSFTFNNGSNSYAGGTTVDTGSNGVVGIGADGTPLGTGAVTFTSTGGVLRADGAARTLTNAINLSSGATFTAAGTFPLTLTGTVDLQAAAAPQVVTVIGTAGAPLTLAGTIQNGPGGLTKNGPGELVLTGTSTYTGPTVANAGVLRIGNGGTAGAIATGSAVSVNTGAILEFRRSDAVTFPNTIGAGGGSVVHSGTGTTTLTGTNLYAGGTTVSAGTLLANGQAGTNSGTGTGPVAVLSGGTLGGNGGAAGGITVSSGGTLAPGIPGALPGTLTTQAAVNLVAGSTFRVVIASGSTPGAGAALNSGSSATPSLGNSYLDAGTNAIVFNSPNVVVDVTGVTFTGLQTYSFQVAQGTGVSPAGAGPTQVNVPQFTFLNNGVDVSGSFVSGASSLYINGAGTANNVYLNFTPVPEPATVLAVAGLGLGLLRLRRQGRVGLHR